MVATKTVVPVLWTWVLGLALAASLAGGTGALAAGAGGGSSLGRGDALREARTLISEQRYEEALAELEEVVAADAGNADAWNLVGFSHRKLERYGPALEGYEKALAIDPRHTEAIEYLGELYLALDDLAQAEEQLAKLVAICGLGCDEYEELKEAIVRYRAARGG